MIAANVAIRNAAAAAGVKYFQIMSRDCRKPVSRARAEAMKAMRASGWKLTAIGEVFGRHHSTVIALTDDRVRRRKRDAMRMRQLRKRVSA